jgi:hypothetical protein
MSKIIEIVRNFNVQLALKNIFTKIDEIIKKLNDVENNTSIITGSLTADQINALGTNPITLLGDAGANKYYVIENTALHYKAGTTGFTTSGNLRLKYVTANRNIVTVQNSSTLSGTTNRVYLGYLASLDLENTVINDSISIDCSAAISGGDGTINYSIKYRTVTTS